MPTGVAGWRESRCARRSGCEADGERVREGFGERESHFGDLKRILEGV